MSLPAAPSSAIAIAIMAFSNRARLEALETHRNIMFRCESMVFILLKEPIINFSV
jgi:hypothetical protein